MQNELDALAQRIQQLADLTRQLRMENQQLRQRGVEQDAEIRRLNGLLTEARHRVEAVIARMPEEPADAEAHPKGAD